MPCVTAKRTAASYAASSFSVASPRYVPIPTDDALGPNEVARKKSPTIPDSNRRRNSAVPISLARGAGWSTLGGSCLGERVRLFICRVRLTGACPVMQGGLRHCHCEDAPLQLHVEEPSRAALCRLCHTRLVRRVLPRTSGLDADSSRHGPRRELVPAHYDHSAVLHDRCRSLPSDRSDGLARPKYLSRGHGRTRPRI